MMGASVAAKAIYNHAQKPGGFKQMADAGNAMRYAVGNATKTYKKKKLTSVKTASDPNSRINKSLKAWNC